jgi:1-pyrroline-5-carboxylate dehydrogenase
MATMTEIPPFTNEPLLDWNDPDNVRQMEEALAQVRSEFKRTYPLVVGGRRITDGGTEKATSPSNRDLVIGEVVQANAEQAR